MVTWDTQSEQEKALSIARRLDLPISSLSNCKNQDNPYELRVSAEGVRLVMRDIEGEHSLFAEFTAGPLFYRIKKGGGKNEDLARACGLKKIKGHIRILDLSAGLGRDAFILASLGVSVHLIERSPIIMTLLEDGLERAKKNVEIASIVTQNMSLSLDDAMSTLEYLPVEQYPDVIYFDPMFDKVNKSALNKIEMRIIRAIVGEDNDAPDILQMALKRARRRVVVKRMRYSNVLQGPVPSFTVKGKSCRYDIYLTGLSA